MQVIPKISYDYYDYDSKPVSSLCIFSLEQSNVGRVLVLKRHGEAIESKHIDHKRSIPSFIPAVLANKWNVNVANGCSYQSYHTPCVLDHCLSAQTNGNMSSPRGENHKIGVIAIIEK